jgi:hypothetical protein
MRIQGVVDGFTSAGVRVDVRKIAQKWHAYYPYC